MSSSGLTIRCSACGGNIPIETIGPELRCSFCGRPQLLDPARLAELQRYRQQVQNQQILAEAAARVAASWEPLARGIPRKQVVYSLLVIVAVPFVLGLTALLVVQACPGREVLAQRVMFGVGWAALIVGLFAYLVWWRRVRRAQAHPASMAPIGLRCPSCGADAQIAPGQLVERCAHCGASLMPSRTIMHEGLQAAALTARAARLAGLRAERQGVVALQRHAHTSRRWPAYVLGVFFGGGFCIAGIGITVEALRGEAPFDSRLLLVWAMPVGIAGGVWLWFRYRDWRRAVWGAGAKALAQEFRGERLAGVAGVVAWLDRYWPVSYDPYNLVWGPHGAGLALDVEGFPALVIYDPVPFDDGPPAKLHALLAAILPGIPAGTSSDSVDGPPPATALARELHARDFRLLLSPAGVRLEAGEGALRRHTRPPSALPALGDVLRDAARLARALDGEPAPPA